MIDVAYILTKNLRLIRAISNLYGARRGFIGSFRLTRSVLNHQAVTSTVAIGGGLVQQVVVGHGLASRLSTRLGKGVVNGLITARIGLAAHDLCRPVSFTTIKRPGVTRYINMLAGLGTKKETS